MAALPIRSPDFWVLAAASSKGGPVPPATAAKRERLAVAEAVAGAMRDSVPWRTPNPVFALGRGLEPTV
jgi:hypothetical protein